jgi:hypothetical protein
VIVGEVEVLDGKVVLQGMVMVIVEVMVMVIVIVM